MQAVILAAGKGKRMGALSKELPKPLTRIAGKTLLEHKFDALPADIDEMILVVGHLQEKIRERFGNFYKGKKITYVEQQNPVAGTMDALLQAKDLVKGRFLVSNGDDIHRAQDIAECLKHDWALAIMQMSELDQASRVVLDAEGKVLDIVEADVHKGGAGLAGVGLYVLDSRIFNVKPVKLQGRDELGLPQTMVFASKALNIPITAVEVSFVLHISSPEDAIRAEHILSSPISQ